MSFLFPNFVFETRKKVAKVFEKVDFEEFGEITLK
jgi:hypothetical protein